MKLLVMIFGLIFVYAYAFGGPSLNPPPFSCSSGGEEKLFVYFHELKKNKVGSVTAEDLNCLQHFANTKTIKPGCDDSGGAMNYGLYDLDDSCLDPSKQYLNCINNNDVKIMQDFISGNSTLKSSALSRAIHVQRSQQRGCSLSLSHNCSYDMVALQLLDINADLKLDINDANCINEAFLNQGKPVNSSCKALSDTTVSYSPMLNSNGILPMSSLDPQQFAAYVGGSKKASDLPLIKWVGDYHSCKEGGVNQPPLISSPSKNIIRQVFVNKLEYVGIQFYDYDNLGNDLSDSAILKVINAPANYSLKNLPPKGQYSMTFMPQPGDDGKVITTQFEVTDAIDANLKTTHSVDFKIDVFKVIEYEPATGYDQGIPDVSLVDNGKIINIPDQSIVSYPEDCVIGVVCDMGIEVPINLPSGVNWQAEIVNGKGPHPDLPSGNPAPKITSLGDDKFLFSWTPDTPVENQEIRIRYFFEAEGKLDNSAGFFKYYRFNVKDKLGINLIAGYPENNIRYVFTDQNPAYWLNTSVVGGKKPYSATTYSMAPVPVPNTQIDYAYDGISYGTFSFDPITDGNLKFLDGFLGDSYNVTFEATDAEGSKASASLNLIVSDLRLEFNPQPTNFKKYQIPVGTRQIIKVTPKGGIAPISMSLIPNDLIPGSYTFVGNDFYFDASLLTVGEVFSPTFTVRDSRSNEFIERKYPIQFEIVSSLIIEPRNIAQGTYRAWKEHKFQLPFVTDTSGPEVASSYYVNGSPALKGIYNLDTGVTPPIFELDLTKNNIKSGQSLTFDFGVNSSLGKKYEITAGIDIFDWNWRIVSKNSQNGHGDLLDDPGSNTTDATLKIKMRKLLPHMFTIILPDPGPNADWTGKIVSYTPKIPTGLGGVALLNFAENKTHFDFWSVGPAQVGEKVAHFRFTDGYTTIDRKLRYEVGEPTDLTFGVSPIAKEDTYFHFKDWGNFELDLIAQKGKAPYTFSMKEGQVSGMSIDQDEDKFIYENDKMILGNNGVTLMVEDAVNDKKELDINVKVSDLQIAFNPEPDEKLDRDHLLWNVPNDTINEFTIATRVDVGTVNHWTFWAGEEESQLPLGSYKFSGVLGNLTLYPKNIPNGLYTVKLFAQYFAHGVTREYTLTFNVGPEDTVLVSEDCEYNAFYDDRLPPGQRNICLKRDEVLRMDFATGYPAEDYRLHWRDSIALVNLNAYLDPQTITGDPSFCFVNDREDLKKSLMKYSDLDIKQKIENPGMEVGQVDGKRDMYSTNVFYKANSQSGGPGGPAFFGSSRCGEMITKYTKYGTYNKFSDVDIKVEELEYVFPEPIKELEQEEAIGEIPPTQELTLNEIKLKYDQDGDGKLNFEEQGLLAQDINAGVYPHLDQPNIQITSEIDRPEADPIGGNLTLEENNNSLHQNLDQQIYKN